MLDPRNLQVAHRARQSRPSNYAIDKIRRKRRELSQAHANASAMTPKSDELGGATYGLSRSSPALYST
jgi:hypothetical protein